MKKIIFINIFILSFILGGCNKFDEINSNPDATNEANAKMLATTVILKNFKFSGRDAMAYISDNGMAKYVAYANQSIMSSQYGFLGATSFSDMTILPNIEHMEKYAVGIPSENSYKGLAKFSRAYLFYNLTMKVGDIPYTKAGQGASELLIEVPYDTQEDVFKGILAELKEADAYFADGLVFAGDPTPFNGDPTKWRRAVNTFRLKVLLSLSKKIGASSIPIVEDFENTVQHAPLLEAATGFLGLNYSAVNMHPLFSTNPVITSRAILSTLLVDGLKAHNDRRLFYYGEPAARQIAAGKQANEFDAYAGAKVEENYDLITAAYLNGDYSAINLRYQQNVASDPRIILGYAELQLILAEAHLRGWISIGSAKDYYENGVKEGLKYIMNTAASYAHGMPINQAYIDGYFTGEAAFKSTMDDQLKQVWIQKYFMNFMQDPIHCYYEYRRTAFPDFPINPLTSLNENKRTALPMRWLYPTNEGTRNQDNLLKALQQQYNGVDEVNQLMWLLK